MDEAHDTVLASYGRVKDNPRFFEDFYVGLLAGSPAIALKFRMTNMSQQSRHLRDAIAFLLMHYEGVALGTNVVRRLGRIHDAEHFGISISLYEEWTRCLMRMLMRHDPQFSPDLEAAWRRVLEPGVSLMKDAYRASLGSDETSDPD